MISREEAIKYLKFIRRKSSSLFVNAKEFELSIDKAISDMQKLEKIEKIVDGFWGNDTDSLKTLVQVKKIVKEV